MQNATSNMWKRKDKMALLHTPNILCPEKPLAIVTGHLPSPARVEHKR